MAQAAGGVVARVGDDGRQDRTAGVDDDCGGHSSGSVVLLRGLVISSAFFHRRIVSMSDSSTWGVTTPQVRQTEDVTGTVLKTLKN